MCNRAPLSLCCCSEPCSHYKHDGPSVEHLSSLHFSGPTASLSLSTFICHYDTRRLQGKHCGWYCLMLGLVRRTAAPDQTVKNWQKHGNTIFPRNTCFHEYLWVRTHFGSWLLQCKWKRRTMTSDEEDLKHTWLWVLWSHIRTLFKAKVRTLFVITGFCISCIFWPGSKWAGLIRVDGLCTPIRGLFHKNHLSSLL